jgi:hypothetical protein
VRVLADVSLQVDAGEVVAVLAQRAQGKTSLLRVAAGIQRPDRGCVCFEGEDLWGFSDRRRSRLLGGQIGWVGPTVPDLDVPMLANVALPLFAAYGKREAYARATAALERVGASGVRAAVLGEPGGLGACARRDRPGDRSRAEAVARRRSDGLARARGEPTTSRGCSTRWPRARIWRADERLGRRRDGLVWARRDAGRRRTAGDAEVARDAGNIIDFPGVGLGSRDPRRGVSS